MGVDVCYTNHAEADADDADGLLTLLAAAGCTYFMGVPGADDPMLAYQSTSFHDAGYLRQLLGLRPAPEFEAWLERVGLTDATHRLLPVTDRHRLLTAGRLGEPGVTGGPRGSASALHNATQRYILTACQPRRFRMQMTSG